MSSDVAVRKFFSDLASMLCQSMKGFNSLVTKHAEELGLDSLGVFKDVPKNSVVLEFPRDHNLRINWESVRNQLSCMGIPKGLYTVPKLELLGVRGDKMDILIRLTDIHQRRIHSIARYLEAGGNTPSQVPHNRGSEEA